VPERIALAGVRGIALDDVRGVALDDVRGFVFDVDGTLVHRGPDGRGRPAPGAVEALQRIRSSGRPLVLFTNGSHVGPATIARGLREDGLPIGDDEVLTPVESAVTYLRRRHRGRPTLVFATDVTLARMAAAGIPLAQGEEAEAVFVAHVDEIDIASLERAARAVSRGAPLLTGSYAPGYAGANGMIFSRGAMVAAAIAKVSGARPKVLGKPSRAAVAELSVHLGLPSRELAVIGDDLGMDIALGRRGGSRTVLVRSGISGQIDLERVPERRRPDAVIDGVAELLGLL
jgi:HAD superfamily hydrolase (TIGR01450 family)